MDQGIDDKYLSSYCLESNDFNRSVAVNSGESYDGDKLYQCYQDFGIYHQENECSKYLLMPRNQSFIIEKLTPEKITGFEFTDTDDSFDLMKH